MSYDYKKYLQDINFGADEEIDDSSDEADSKTAASVEDLEREREIAELADKSQDRQLRKEYANKIFELVTYWIKAVATLLFFTGLNISDTCQLTFDLDSKILMVLVGSTTLGVVGLLGIVIKYLFSR